MRNWIQGGFTPGDIVKIAITAVVVVGYIYTARSELDSVRHDVSRIERMQEKMIQTDNKLTDAIASALRSQEIIATRLADHIQQERDNRVFKRGDQQ